MREIKFRAFHEPTKQMFDVFSFDVNNVRAWSPEKYGLEISPDREDCILMQYTGLKDKYGVDIYEGDIVRVVDVSFEKLGEAIGKVRWKSGGYEVRIVGNEIWISTTLTQPNIEIIGNIYENPELLEVE